MTKTKDYSWYTGDWNTKGNNKQAPYNGVQIIASAEYSDPGSPPVSQKLVSVELTIVDFTKDPIGVSSIVTLDKTGVWYTAPTPMDNSVSPPQPNLNYTVTTNLARPQGTFCLDASSAGTYLNIQFDYGLEHAKREELGFIMKIDTILTEGVEPIQVEQ